MGLGDFGHPLQQGYFISHPPLHLGGMMVRHGGPSSGEWGGVAFEGDVLRDFAGFGLILGCVHWSHICVMKTHTQ